jgi:CP family cyanate transporter-like MFS transporter
MLVGLLRGWTGSFDASAFLFGAIGIALLACAMGAGRNRYLAAVTAPC